MKPNTTGSMKPMAKVTVLILVLGTVDVLSGRLLAQEPGTPPEREPVTPTITPGNAPSPGRLRAVRMPLSENNSTPAPERMPSRSLASSLRPPPEIAPARFEAAVYEVQVPEKRVAELEAPALEAKAGTLQDLAKALGDFGKTRVLYKIDQLVNLYGESITLGTREPMVTGTRRAESGPALNTITYQEVGLVVNLAASLPVAEGARPDLRVQVNFELSVLADSEVEISPQLKATRIRNMHLSHSETPRFGKPLVLLNVSAPPGSDKDLPVAYVVRYVFHDGRKENP